MHTFTDAQIQELEAALHYLNLNELRILCNQFLLSTMGNKISLIERIMLFVRTGEKLESQQIPTVSKAQRHVQYPLKPETRMLFGSYKNDAKTRVFFKTLIGEHFHYTAFGIDWVKKRWLAGQPPLYIEFAQYWQEEYAKRKLNRPAPKREWAYICFTQKYLQQHPTATKEDLNKKWHKERQLAIEKVRSLLNCRM